MAAGSAVGNFGQRYTGRDIKIACHLYSKGELIELDMYKYDDYGRLIEPVCYDGDEELLLSFALSGN